MTRRGFTLIELLLAVAVVGLLTGIAVPVVLRWRDRFAVEALVAATTSALDQARGAAVRLQCPVVVEDSLGVIRVRIDSAGGSAPLTTPIVTGAVALSGLANPIRFGGLGLTLGASNRTLVFERGGVVRRLVLSRLGRIR
jgi:prepilin-type N-terminal cleavage/methylation domain-containing protein